MGRRRPSYVFDPERHAHRRVWVSLAVALLCLQAALGIKFVQLSARQKKLVDLEEDEFDDLGTVCRVAGVAPMARGYAYYFSVPGATNATARVGNATSFDGWRAAGYKVSKTIASSDDDPAPHKRVVGALTRCWRPASTRVHATFSCGDNRDCYKIFDPKDDLKHTGRRWFLFRCLGFLFCGVALFFTVFLGAFFGFLSAGFRPPVEKEASADGAPTTELAKQASAGDTAV